MAIFKPWPSTRCRICRTTTARSSRTSRARSCGSITTSITRAYVTGANDALDGLAEARAKNDFSKIAALERALAFHVSGHVLHSLFWQNLAPAAGGEPTGALADQITRDFGEFSRFRGELTAAAMTIMGSGWAALIVGSAEPAAADHADPRSPERDHAGRRSDPGARRLGARLLPAVRPREEALLRGDLERLELGRRRPPVRVGARASIWRCHARPDARAARRRNLSQTFFDETSLGEGSALACAPLPFDKERRRCRLSLRFRFWCSVSWLLAARLAIRRTPAQRWQRRRHGGTAGAAAARRAPQARRRHGRRDGGTTRHRRHEAGTGGGARGAARRRTAAHGWRDGGTAAARRRGRRGGAAGGRRRRRPARRGGAAGGAAGRGGTGGAAGAPAARHGGTAGGDGRRGGGAAGARRRRWHGWRRWQRRCPMASCTFMTIDRHRRTERADFCQTSSRTARARTQPRVTPTQATCVTTYAA